MLQILQGTQLQSYTTGAHGLEHWTTTGADMTGQRASEAILRSLVRSTVLASSCSAMRSSKASRVVLPAAPPPAAAT